MNKAYLKGSKRELTIIVISKLLINQLLVEFRKLDELKVKRFYTFKFIQYKRLCLKII